MCGTLTPKLLRRSAHSRVDVKANVINKLQSIVSEANLSTSLAVREQHGKDESYHMMIPPDVVIFPHSTQEVSECAKVCHDNDLPIIPFGTSTGLEGRGHCCTGWCLL
ncbi:putative D-lactate dehydrogenase, mitochondrial [Lamellibrachia satsuma]|nr:putative D-lactate dehydrogenase, mitochondrial [Lamellibrachia satsuma]